MTPDEIATSYDQLADHWNSDDFPRSNGIEQHERAIAFVEQRGNAIDIGCGSSGRLIDLLIESGFSVEGLDISPRMLVLAKQRHPGVEFHLADIRNWSFSKKYDLISAWDSIWHLPMADQEPVLTKILQGLNRGGVCIFTTGGRDAAEEKTDSAMGPPMYYSVLGIPRTLQVISENQCVCRHLEYDQHPEQHVYIIVQCLRKEGSK
ncbi:MAG: methyltransferase domain-containing protein [Woeseiaceae bacterium]|nr:methyltransferase domain-containing protein [Woeseiaceae bacterium]